MKVVLAFGKIENFDLEGARLSSARKEKVDFYRFEEDKKRCALSEALLRRCLEEFGVACDEILYEYNEYGRPSLKGTEGIKFNISHSGSYAVCAMSAEEVGVDIEQIKDMDFSVAKRFFTVEECEKIFSSEDEDGVKQRFYDCWTKKEAYIKWLGKGAYLPLDSFNVYGGLGCFFEEIDIFDGYKSAICTKEKIDELETFSCSLRRSQY